MARIFQKAPNRSVKSLAQLKRFFSFLGSCTFYEVFCQYLFEPPLTCLKKIVNEERKETVFWGYPTIAKQANDKRIDKKSLSTRSIIRKLITKLNREIYLLYFYFYLDAKTDIWALHANMFFYNTNIINLLIPTYSCHITV